MSRALLLIDLQEDYLAAAGLAPARGEVVARAAWLLQRCRAAGIPVVHVWTTVRRDADSDERMSHWRRDGLWRCVAGTPGHAAPAAVAPAAGEHVVHKMHFSAFAGGPLDEWLRARGVEEVWLAGVHVHACVRATVLGADRLGFAVKVAADAVASDQPLHADETRRYLTRRCAAFVPAAALLASCERTARAGAAASREGAARLPAAVVRGVACGADDAAPTLPHKCPSERGRVLWEVPVAGARAIDEVAACARAGGAAWRARVRRAPRARGTRRRVRRARARGARAAQGARDQQAARRRAHRGRLRAGADPRVAGARGGAARARRARSGAARRGAPPSARHRGAGDAVERPARDPARQAPAGAALRQRRRLEAGAGGQRSRARRAPSAR